MRKIVLALAAVAALGIAVPTFASTPAEASVVKVIKRNGTVTVIKKHRHFGRYWYKHRHMRHAHLFVR